MPAPLIPPICSVNVLALRMAAPIDISTRVPVLFFPVWAKYRAMQNASCPCLDCLPYFAVVWRNQLECRSNSLCTCIVRVACFLTSTFPRFFKNCHNVYKKRMAKCKDKKCGTLDDANRILRPYLRKKSGSGSTGASAASGASAAATADT